MIQFLWCNKAPALEYSVSPNLARSFKIRKLASQMLCGCWSDFLALDCKLKSASRKYLCNAFKKGSKNGIST